MGKIIEIGRFIAVQVYKKGSKLSQLKLMRELPLYF